MSEPDFSKSASGPANPYDTSAAGLGTSPTYLAGGAGGGSGGSFTVNVQHNDASVGSQDAIDFEDQAGQLAWTVTNDTSNGRIKITPTVTYPTQHAYSSQGSSFPGSPSAGDTFWLVRGDIQMPFTYTGANWYSPVFYTGNLVSENAVTQTDVGSPTYIGTPAAGQFLTTADTAAAGCSLFVRGMGLISGSSGKAAHVQILIEGYGILSSTDFSSTAANAFVLGPWQNCGAGAVTLGRFEAYGYRDSGGAGITVTFTNIGAQYYFRV